MDYGLSTVSKLWWTENVHRRPSVSLHCGVYAKLCAMCTDQDNPLPLPRLRARTNRYLRTLLKKHNPMKSNCQSTSQCQVINRHHSVLAMYLVMTERLIYTKVIAGAEVFIASQVNRITAYYTFKLLRLQPYLHPLDHRSHSNTSRTCLC